MHASKEGRVNLSQKNSGMVGASEFKIVDGADELGDGENVDESYQQTIDEMQNL